MRSFYACPPFSPCSIYLIPFCGSWLLTGLHSSLVWSARFLSPTSVPFLLHLQGLSPANLMFTVSSWHELLHTCQPLYLLFSIPSSLPSVFCPVALLLIFEDPQLKSIWLRISERATRTCVFYCKELVSWSNIPPLIGVSVFRTGSWK